MKKIDKLYKTHTEYKEKLETLKNKIESEQTVKSHEIVQGSCKLVYELFNNFYKESLEGLGKDEEDLMSIQLESQEVCYILKRHAFAFDEDNKREGGFERQ